MATEITLNDYGFFDWQQGDGETYKYTADEFSRIIDMITGSGVVRNQLNRFDGTWNAASAMLSIATGAAIIDGHWAISETTNTYTFTSNGTYYVSLDVNIGERVVNILIEKQGDEGVVEPTAPYYLYKVTVLNGVITTLEDKRSFVYNGSSFGSCPIIVADNAPAVQNGAIWLKPISLS